VTTLRQSLWACALLLAAAPAARAPAQATVLAPPARDWTLPLFTKEGYRQLTLRGDVVQAVTADRVEIKGMNVTVFSGLADGRVDSVVLSPAATFLINEKVAHGDSTVRVVRDDLEVTGEGWTYLYNEKKVLISRHARVVFHTALPDFLK
jgi:hypothetical protein